MADSDRIVVGVDGSEHARRALDWAVAESRLRGAPLQVVHVWQYPYGVAAAGPPDIHVRLRSELERDAKDLLDEAVEAAGCGPETVRTLHEGPAVEVLCRESADAALLVLGSRGRGGFSSLLLGSTSQQCAHHVRCPLVIVPPPRR